MSIIRLGLKLLIVLLLPSVCRAQTDVLPAYLTQPSFQISVKHALLLQMQADSLFRTIEENNALLLTATGTAKASIRNTIRDDHTWAVALQKEAEEWFAKANAQIIANQKEVKKIRQVIDTAQYEMQQAYKQAISEFEILDNCPYSSKNPIPIDPPLPDGVVYKIQLGAFNKAISMNTFKGLSPVSGEKLPSGTIKYYVGLFRTYVETESALREVKKYGYKDSYVVAFYNKKTIIPTRAQELEKITQ
jgi:hypothetical protein